MGACGANGTKNQKKISALSPLFSAGSAVQALIAGQETSLTTQASPQKKIRQIRVIRVPDF